jgi:hypothetical protein
MTLPVVFRRAARREFDEAALWYEERRAGLGHHLSRRLITPLSWCWKIHSAFPSCTARFDVFERVASRIQSFFVRRPYVSPCLPCLLRAVIPARRIWTARVVGPTMHFSK